MSRISTCSVGVLRGGDAVGKTGCLGILRRLLPRLHKAFPKAKIRIRLDAGFAGPELYEFFEAERMEYVVCMGRNAKGDLKDMACRSLLVKLHQRDYIQLPARRQTPSRRMARHIPDVAHDTLPIDQSLKALRPLRVIDVHCYKDDEPLFSCLLSRYHYLGYTSPVGENMKYLVVDSMGRPMACLLFGSSAWSCASRDATIGWDSSARQRNLQFTTNNTRFLIFPWVRVPHLASHILALISRRISADWLCRYGHAVYLLETFVDRTRFSGTCYRAANWQHVGQTRGRSRNDRHSQMKVPIKSVFLYPLVADYQAKLST